MIKQRLIKLEGKLNNKDLEFTYSVDFEELDMNVMLEIKNGVVIRRLSMAEFEEIKKIKPINYYKYDKKLEDFIWLKKEF